MLELKRGRASDVVVGQVLRYIGYVKEEVAEADQTVEGVIIALEDDQRLRWALSSVPAVTFYVSVRRRPPCVGVTKQCLTDED